MAVAPTTQLGALDHVALWVRDRDTLAEFLCAHLGMHEIERSGDFTLVGADARRGKLTLFAAEGEREPGPLARVVLRVGDLEQALAALPAELQVERAGDALALFVGPERLGLGLVEASNGPVDYDIDHVVLQVPDPDLTRAGMTRLGFALEGKSLTAGDKRIEIVAGPPGDSASPLLNHIAVLVDSGRDWLDWARDTGLEVDDVRDAPNTFAVFVRGPDGIRIEYVEHKASFSLV
jgi:catechol 2,3-dioxygenase-like lactoylglutathione lyase family enzyme